MSSIRTGYEMVVAHRTSYPYASSADEDGVVESINDDTKQIVIRYAEKAVQTTGTIDVSLPKAELEQRLAQGRSVYIVVPGSQGSSYRIDDVKEASAKVNLRVAEIHTMKTVEAVPNFSQLSRSLVNDLQQKLKSGAETEVLYIRLDPIGKTLPGKKNVLAFGDVYSSVSGSALRQRLLPNVSVGDSFKRGDILVYNIGFFQPVRGTKQVAWKHGVEATVALIEIASTHEDSCVISNKFGQTIKMAPAQERMVSIKNTTVLHEFVEVGTDVQTTDPLCLIEDGELDALSLGTDEDTIAFLSGLNKATPLAKYYGRVVQLDMQYSCPIESMHPTLQKLANSIAARKKLLHDQAVGTDSEHEFPEAAVVDVGAKSRGILFEDDTVVLIFTISTELSCERGDKLCLMSAMKTTVGAVAERPMTTTLTGTDIDILFAATSVSNRMILSSMKSGVGNRVAREIRRTACNIYYDRPAV